MLRYGYMRATSLPAALVFLMVSAIAMAAMLYSAMLCDGMMTRLERREQAFSAIHAACVLFGRDSAAFDSTAVFPFPGIGIEVKEKKTMHGLYGMLTLETGLYGKARLSRSYITGVTSLPWNVVGIYVPDRGVTLTLGTDCHISSELVIPRGYFRVLSHGDRELDSLSVHCSLGSMPELSEGAKEILSHTWEDAPEEVTLTGKDTTADAIIWARRIVIGNTFRGRVQAFASDSIVVSGGAYLEYPSGVCLVSDEQASGIRISADAIIEGYAAILDRGGLEQARGSIIRGLVYAPDRSLVGGTLTGCAFLGNPCCRDRRNEESEYTLEHLVQNRNVVYAYPELFAGQPRRTVIRRLEE